MSEIFPDNESSFPKEVQGIKFSECSFLVVSRLLYKDKKYPSKTITKNINLVSQTPPPKGITQSILISKKQEGELELRIASCDSIDVITIATTFSPQRIGDILQRSTSVPSCPIRINTYPSQKDSLEILQRQTWIIKNIQMSSTK